MDESKHLANAQIFRGLSASQLAALLEIAQMEMFDAGQTIFRENEVGTSLYVVMEGQVRVSVDVAGGEEALGMLGPGRSFGEMAAVSEAEERRSASAIAHTDVTLLSIERSALKDLLFHDPELARGVLWNVVQDLSAFVRSTTSKMIFLATTARF